MSSPIIPERRCGICKESFPLTSEFWHKDKKDKQHGFNRDCKECAKARTKKWTADNPGRGTETSQRWRAAHPEEYRAQNLKGSQKRRELTGDALAEHRRKDAEYRKRTSERRIAYNREYRKNNPDWNRRVYTSWRKSNPLRFSISNRNAAHRRRARLSGAGGAGFTKADYELQLRSQKGRCWWCGKPMGDDATIEHVRPIVRGGQHDPRNIVLAHKSCNSSKGSKLPHEWNGRLL